MYYGTAEEAIAHIKGVLLDLEEYIAAEKEAAIMQANKEGYDDGYSAGTADGWQEGYDQARADQKAEEQSLRREEERT